MRCQFLLDQHGGRGHWHSTGLVMLLHRFALDPRPRRTGQPWLFPHMRPGPIDWRLPPVG
jgi:hypothetical protein